MFAEKFFLGIATNEQEIVIKLLLESICFPRRKHGHEFQFETDMVGPLCGILRHLQTKRAVKRSEISEPVRLKQRIGIQIAVFDFVERTISARGMTERHHVRDLERFKSVFLQTRLERARRIREMRSATGHSSHCGLERSACVNARQPLPNFCRRIIECAREELIEERASNRAVDCLLQTAICAWGRRRPRRQFEI